MGFKTSNFKFKHLLDPKKIYFHIYWINILTGFYPRKFENTILKYFFKIYKIVLVITYGLSAIFFMIDAYIVRKDLERLSFNLTTSVLLCVTVLKISMVTRRSSNFETILDELDNNLHMETVGNNAVDQAIFAKKETLITIFARYFYLSLLFIYILRIAAEYISGTKYYLIPVPFKEELDDYYQVVYAQQIASSIHFLATVVSHDLLVYGIVIRLIAHFEILTKNIRQIKSLYPNIEFQKYVPGYREVEEESDVINDVLLREGSDVKKFYNFFDFYGFDKWNLGKGKRLDKGTDRKERQVFRDEATDRYLRSCIFYHQKILRVTQTFCEVYSPPLVVQAMGSVVLSGIVALHTLFLTSELTPMLAQQVLYVVTTLMNILYLCSLGTEITEKSIQAAYALYDIPWYQMSVQNRKTLRFCMQRLQKGPQLKGGGIVVFNRITYLKFLQTSYNLVAVLKNGY